MKVEEWRNARHCITTAGAREQSVMGMIPTTTMPRIVEQLLPSDRGEKQQLSAGKNDKRFITVSNIN